MGVGDKIHWPRTTDAAADHGGDDTDEVEARTPHRHQNTEKTRHRLLRSRQKRERAKLQLELARTTHRRARAGTHARTYRHTYIHTYTRSQHAFIDKMRMTTAAEPSLCERPPNRRRPGRTSSLSEWKRHVNVTQARAAYTNHLQLLERQEKKKEEEVEDEDGGKGE